MSLLFASFVTFVAVILLSPLAVKIGLVDRPNERKLHKGSIPLIGGIAIYTATLVTCVIFLPSSTTVNLFLISTGFIVFVGVLDDYKDLSVRLRLVAQVLIASILVFGAGMYISNLGDLFFVGDIDIGIAGTIFTIVTVIAAINAFNMTDGIDGLAGSLAMTTFCSIGLLMHLNGTTWSLVPILLVIAIVPFLAFNLGVVPGPVKKIFMGDAGSMFIGLSVIWLLTIGTQGETPSFRPVTALWLIALPLMDMAAIIYRRVKKGQSPFKPDRDHLHHIFLRAGFSSRGALLVIFTLSLVLAAFGIVGELGDIPEALMLAAFILLFSLYSYGINHIWRVVRGVRRLRIKAIRQKNRSSKVSN